MADRVDEIDKITNRIFDIRINVAAIFIYRPIPSHLLNLSFSRIPGSRMASLASCTSLDLFG